jgi:hypothetical protein
MKNKSKIIVVVFIAVVALVAIFGVNIRYFFSGGKDIVVAPPDAFCFYLATNNDQGEVYHLSDEPYNVEDGEDGYDENTMTYHLFVDDIFLENNDAYVYITGSYWNYPYNPIVKVDGKIVNEISSENSGYSDGMFSDPYLSRLYHFYYKDKILLDHTYEIYEKGNSAQYSLSNLERLDIGETKMNNHMLLGVSANLFNLIYHNIFY